MKRTNDFLVGATVLGIIGLVTAALIWINQSEVGQRRHRLTARFHDVGNARVGNVAVIRGVRGGRIEAIELAPGGWVHVRMALDPGVELPRDPIVLLNESSLFGEWQATIDERASQPRDETVRAQIRDASGGGAVVPGATLPGIGKLTAVAGEIAGDVASVANRVEVAFDDQAARELRGSIRNISELSSVLAHTVRGHASDLDSLSGQLRLAVGSLNRTAATVERMAQDVDTSSMRGQVHKIVDDAAASSAELRLASRQIRDLSERFAKSQVRLDAFLANGDSVLAKINRGQGSLGMLVNDPSLYRSSDSVMVQLKALIADIKANPKKYVSIRIF
jgi:phospholipid/cholesterol/gamma-HCH transport system substrate-binding protein